MRGEVARSTHASLLRRGWNSRALTATRGHKAIGAIKTIWVQNDPM
jgi:hypothetical protein